MKEKKGQKLTRFIILFLLLTAALLGLVQIYLSNRMAGLGKELSRLQQEIKYYQEENKNLQVNFISNQGLKNLSQEAIKLGFKNNPPILNLSPRIPVALKTY